MSPTAQLILTNRDSAIFEMTFGYGGVSIAHLLKRFWTSPGARAAGYARISRLVEVEYLGTQRLPGKAGIGSGPLFITIGPKARPVLARLLSCSVASLRRTTRMQAPHQIHHHLATCDFRLALELAVEDCTRVASMEWTPEWELRRTPITVKDPKADTTITIVPDGAFTLTLTDGSEQSFAVEIDMATMTELRRLRTRFRGYLIAAKESPMPVLWVTTTKARADTLARLAAKEAEKLKGGDQTIFWMTTQQAVTAETVLTAPIWQVVSGPTALSLLGEPLEMTAPIADSYARMAEGVLA